MKMPFAKSVLPALALLCAGCFTLHESPYPATAMTRPSVAGATVSVRGFEARIAEYVNMSGISTVYVDGPYYGGPWYGAGYWETVPVYATVARSRPTDQFLERAKNRFEEAGWAVMAQVPDSIVELRFLEVEMDSFWSRALRVVGTLFFSDRAVLTCRARMKIYDNRSGKLLFTRDYEETDDESMWSPILVLGPLAYRQTDYDLMRLRCLAALTDRATADASAFLAAKN